MNTQTFATTLRAELARPMGKGGARTWFIVAVAFSLVITAGTVAIASLPALQDIESLAVADIASSAPIFAVVVLALAATSHKAREIGDGTVLTSKALVPRSLMLFTARLTAWAVITLGIGVITTVMGFIVAVVPPAIAGSSVVQLLTATATSLFMTMLVVLSFAATAALLQRGALIVFVGLLLILILPAGLSIASFFVPEVLATVALNIAQALPGVLLLIGTQPPNQGSEITWFEWGRSVFGIVAWISALSLLGYRQFRKPGYGDR